MTSRLVARSYRSPRAENLKFRGEKLQGREQGAAPPGPHSRGLPKWPGNDLEGKPRSQPFGQLRGFAGSGDLIRGLYTEYAVALATLLRRDVSRVFPRLRRSPLDVGRNSRLCSPPCPRPHEPFVQSPLRSSGLRFCPASSRSRSFTRAAQRPSRRGRRGAEYSWSRCLLAPNTSSRLAKSDPPGLVRNGPGCRS